MAHKKKTVAKAKNEKVATAAKKAVKTAPKAREAASTSARAASVSKSAPSKKPVAKSVTSSATKRAQASPAQKAPSKPAARAAAKVAVSDKKATEVKVAKVNALLGAKKTVKSERREAPKAGVAAAAAQLAQSRAQVHGGARTVPALSKSGGQKITAPATPAASDVPQTPKAIAEKAAAARQLLAAQALAAQKKPVSQRHGFKTNEFIVYPAHGVGRIIGIEEQEIAGISLELFVINFEKEKLTLRVPTGKLQSVGMRKLADDDIVKKAMEILKGRARIKRTMWSRRAQEYVAKINSGDLVSIAEVVRDLYRSDAQPEQSYSERQLYEDALDRMAREIAAVEKLDERGAVQLITDVLSKSARGRRLTEEGEAEIQAA